MNVYLSLGSNIGDGIKIIDSAVKIISEWKEISSPESSSFYSTSPVSSLIQKKFTNAILKFQTDLDPHQLMERCWDLEKRYGIKEPVLDGPRALDIDLIFYGDKKINTEKLQVPHPRWKERLFVLVPLKEFEPSIIGFDLQKLIDEIGSDQRIDKLE